MAGARHSFGPSSGPDAALPAPARQAAGLTVGTLFRHQLERNGGRVALDCAGRALTYAELGERVGRLVHALAAKGVGRGDRIAVVSENRLELSPGVECSGSPALPTLLAKCDGPGQASVDGASP